MSLLLAKPDVTGGPLPTSTTTTSSGSSVSVGAIVGGVIGGVVVIIIGVLIIFWAVRRHRRRRTHTTPMGSPSFNASQPVTMSMPLTGNRTTVQPSPPGYAYGPNGRVSSYLTSSPTHSATSLSLTSPLASPLSPGFSTSGHGAVFPITDAADMISPFLSTSLGNRTNRSNKSPPTGKAAEALSERVMAPPGQRTRLNPPPYSAPAEPGSFGETTTWSRRISIKKQKKRNGSESGATVYSGHSRTSTKESMIAFTGPRTEESRPRAVTPGTGAVKNVESVMSTRGVGSDEGGSVEITNGRRTGVSDRPAA